MRGKLDRRTQVVAGFVLFIVLAVGLSYHQYFDEGVAFEKTPIGDIAQHAPGWIILFLITFALFVIAIALYALVKRDAVIFRAYRIANEGRPDEALEMLRQKMATRPKAVRAAAMGWILHRADRFAEAAEAFAVAEDMEPKTVTFSVERALAMSKIGQGETALAHLRRLRAGNPTEGGYVLATAAVLDEIGRWAEARGEFRRAEDLLAEHPKAFHAQHTISFLRSRLALRVGRDEATGLKAELERAFGQRAPSAATIRDDGANDA
jgi:tetratricopeptide (TPR) repeat protein